MHLLASAVIPLVGFKAALRFRVLGLFSFRDWCKNSSNPVAHTPQKWLLLKLHQGRFLYFLMRLSKAQQSLAFQVPVPTITAEESKAGCCCKQEEKVRQGIALRFHRTGAGERRASGSCRGPYYRSWPSPCPSVRSVSATRSVPLL